MKVLPQTCLHPHWRKMFLVWFNQRSHQLHILKTTFCRWKTSAQSPFRFCRFCRPPVGPMNKIVVVLTAWLLCPAAAAAAQLCHEIDSCHECFRNLIARSGWCLSKVFFDVFQYGGCPQILVFKRSMGTLNPNVLGFAGAKMLFVISKASKDKSFIIMHACFCSCTFSRSFLFWANLLWPFHCNPKRFLDLKPGYGGQANKNKKLTDHPFAKTLRSSLWPHGPHDCHPKRNLAKPQEVVASDGCLAMTMSSCLGSLNMSLWFLWSFPILFRNMSKLWAFSCAFLRDVWWFRIAQLLPKVFCCFGTEVR